MRKVNLKKSERVMSCAFYFLELRSFLSMNGMEWKMKRQNWWEIKEGLLVNECPQIICYECINSQPTSTFIMGNEGRTLGLYTAILKTNHLFY